MVMGHSRLGPNTSNLILPSNTAVTHTILQAEFPTEVEGFQVSSSANVASDAVNYFTLTLQKYDSTFGVTRVIASVTNNGTAWTAGVPQIPTISTAEDATNYTPPTYQLPQPYRKLRPGDRLQLVLTTAGTTPPNVQLCVAVRFAENSQISGRGAY